MYRFSDHMAFKDVTSATGLSCPRLKKGGANGNLYGPQGARKSSHQRGTGGKSHNGFAEISEDKEVWAISRGGKVQE